MQRAPRVGDVSPVEQYGAHEPAATIAREGMRLGLATKLLLALVLVSVVAVLSPVAPFTVISITYSPAGIVARLMSI